MKYIRIIVSGGTTLLMAAVAAAGYLLTSFRNENPRALFEDSLLVQIIVSFIAVHFMVKGSYLVVIRGKKRMASAGLFISVGIIITGLIVSSHVRRTEYERVVVSEKVGSITIQDIKMKLPENLLVIGDRSDFKFGYLEVIAGTQGKDVVIKPVPFTRTPGGLSYVNDAGLSPSVTIQRNGNTYVLDKMQLLPPGREYAAHMGDNLKAVISIKHERKFMKGRLSAFQYDLTSPGYHIMLKNGKNTIFDEDMKRGERRTEGTVAITLGKTQKWAEVVFVRDFAVYIIYAGLTGIIIFALLYPFEVFWRF